jgi:hypothetical protein
VWYGIDHKKKICDIDTTDWILHGGTPLVYIGIYIREMSSFYANQDLEGLFL